MKKCNKILFIRNKQLYRTLSLPLQTSTSSPPFSSFLFRKLFAAEGRGSYLALPIPLNEINSAEFMDSSVKETSDEFTSLVIAGNDLLVLSAETLLKLKYAISVTNLTYKQSDFVAYLNISFRNP
jgi:hypothetical protein